MVPPTQRFNLDVEAISGICGSISIACWIVVFSPQIIQNFKRRSSEGLSAAFIVVWTFGDIFNVIGAVLQGVLPTMIILALYYCLADVVLLWQCFFYDSPPTPSDDQTATPKPSNTTRVEANERTRLLDSPTVLSRRNSADWSALSPVVPHMPEPSSEPERRPSILQTIAWNGTLIVMVCAAGVAGWFLSHKTSGEKHEKPHDEEDELHFNVLGQVFGYLCTVAYIASRIPQLVLNWRRGTTDGLSMLFFILACAGNATYVLSIVAFDPKCHKRACTPSESREIYGQYILINLSWLLGSLLTLLLDLGVFAQYFIFQRQQEKEARQRNSPPSNGPQIESQGHHA